MLLLSEGLYEDMKRRLADKKYIIISNKLR